MLGEGANTHITDKFGNSPLHWAVQWYRQYADHLKIVDSLIRSNPILIDRTTMDGKTPLHFAAQQGHLPMIQLLLSNEAKTNIVDIEGKIPLQVAIEHGHFEAVKLLYNDQAKNIIDKSGKTLIHLAAAGGNIEVLQFLMSKLDSDKEIINVKDNRGKSPMHLAVQNGHINLLEWFQQHGSDMHARDHDGNTALHIAVKQNHPEIVQKLVELGININVGNKTKDTAIKIANNNLRIIKNKPTNKEIQRIFQDNNLIVRSGKIREEIHHLHTISHDGNSGNIERMGNRSRSSTLLLPEVNMQLYYSDLEEKAYTGLLYDADKVTIRQYMLQDANTTLFNENRKNFYNTNIQAVSHVINISKNIISKENFTKEYTNNIGLVQLGTIQYNELLTNFFPESMVGILINATIQEPRISIGKVEALEGKYYISEKYGYDLPMVLVSGGKVEVWNPDLEEIKTLLNSKIESKNTLHKERKEFLNIHPIKLGLIINKNGNIILLNKNEVTFQEFEYFLEKICNKDSTTQNYFKTKLLEVVNNRLSNDDLPKVDNLDNFLIHKEDIGNFVNAVYQEKASSEQGDRSKNNKDLETIANKALKFMQSNRPDKNNFPELQEYKSVKDILKTQPAETVKETEKIATKLKLQQFFAEDPSNKLKTSLGLGIVETIKKGRAL